MTFTTTFRTLSFASLALLGTAAMAQQGVLPAQSSIEFTAKQLGVPLKGHFKQFEAQLQFDVAKPETSTLTSKGQSQPGSVPVTLTQSGDITTATGSLPLQRLSFKIGDGDWADTSMVANEVNVQFKLALTGIGKL